MARAKKATSIIINNTGWLIAAQRPANTAISSAIDKPQLVKGSGDVFAAKRAPALVAWAVAAIVPPKIPALISMAGVTSPTIEAANKAPAGIRTKV